MKDRAFLVLQRVQKGETMALGKKPAKGEKRLPSEKAS